MRHIAYCGCLFDPTWPDTQIHIFQESHLLGQTRTPEQWMNNL